MTTSAHHEEDSHEVPAYVHNSKKTTQSLQDGSASKNLSAPKTASLQKFALLLLRNSASTARQISYMVHERVHEQAHWKTCAMTASSVLISCEYSRSDRLPFRNAIHLDFHPRQSRIIPMLLPSRDTFLEYVCQALI